MIVGAIPEISPTANITRPKHKADSRTFVQFRISLEEHETLLRIAQTAFKEAGIKAPTISALARASLMSMANRALKVAQENLRIAEYDRRRKELQAIAGPSKMPFSMPFSGCPCRD